MPVHQFRGIKYASVPARFRHSGVCLLPIPPWPMPQNMGTWNSYLSDSIRINRPCSPVCPQANHKSLEEDLLGLHESEIPRQVFKQDEFECLNLNVTCPGQLKPGSRLPVMLWIHGYVTAPFECGFLYLHLFILVEEAIAVRVPAGCMMEQG
jgi:carboxylesterase type B